MLLAPPERRNEFDPLKIESISLYEEEAEEERKERNEEEEEEDEWMYTDSEEEFKRPPGFDIILSKGKRGEDEESIWSGDESFESDVSEEDVSHERFDTSVKFPPEWEEDIEKSPQYKCGMLDMFVKRLDLETGPRIDDSEFIYPSEYTGPIIENVHDKLKRRIKAIRETRGYDVEPGIPCFFLGDPFFPARLEDTKTYDKELLDKIMEFVLKQINSHAQAQGCGKSYELVGIEKLVLARAHRVQLITFRAKELSDAAEENMDVEKKTIQAMVFTGGCCNVFQLLEWRFKPQAT